MCDLNRVIITWFLNMQEHPWLHKGSQCGSVFSFVTFEKQFLITLQSHFLYESQYSIMVIFLCMLPYKVKYITKKSMLQGGAILGLTGLCYSGLVVVCEHLHTCVFSSERSLLKMFFLKCLLKHQIVLLFNLSYHFFPLKQRRQWPT